MEYTFERFWYLSWYSFPIRHICEFMFAWNEFERSICF